MMSINTFLYENQEVKMTGRVAIKQVENKYNSKHTEKRLVEITPIDTDMTWTKFVLETELYVISSND